MSISLRHFWLPLFGLLTFSPASFSAEPTAPETQSKSEDKRSEEKQSEQDSASEEAPHTESLLEKRIKEEVATAELPFVITPHNVNYILPVTYNTSPNMEPFVDRIAGGDAEVDEMEAKFQISFKFPLMYNIFGDNGHLFFAYTNQSYWQLYNKEISSPFRETNHSPELFMVFNNDWKLGPLTNSLIAVGVMHQSNGQSGELSRSWNRIYGSMVFDNGPFATAAKVWWRIPEDEKETPTSARGDDNPDILDYMGYFELTSVYGIDEHRVSMMLRNNLQKKNRGAVELTWSYPVIGNLRVYAQYFNGYGESLIDYNAHTNRFGIGVAINDIL
ncbi:phospholipase A [Shewanella sp. Isolate11]|uniref:phospholipase A n=1 Tax=Shewanella sp. Isolate11 TaxID=2908530 RepID=UPI001EFEDA23|nr:phospholipase A [Shewanella sp. Isolate11]MCG9697578.1 phospholipase A [Shewanella sp. Isolate11]